MDFNFPSKDEISIAYQQGEAVVLELFDQIEYQVMKLSKISQDQAEAIKELQAKLSKDSSNSGKPPSSDGLAKKNIIPRTESQRKKGEKPNGGQIGHQGSTLEKSEHPDKTETYSIDEPCTHCGTSLGEVLSNHEERQVFDIPAIRIEITAHRAEIKICPLCGETNKASFPDNVTQATQYGNGIKTWASYFSVQHFIPTARTTQIIEDLVGHRISEATVLNSCHQLVDKVSPVTQIIKEKLKVEEVVNFDETGLRVNGKLHWLHCASTDKLTDYLVHPRRGQEAIDVMGILPTMKGVACHDHWKPYFSYEVRHSLCNAHHIRELTFIEKQYQQAFAPKMADLLIEINTAKKQQAVDHFDVETLTAYFSRYDEIVKEGLLFNPEKQRSPDQKSKKGPVKQTPAYNLLKRFRDVKSAVLLFMVDFNVPFTNNQAEQDVRMVKVKQKVSGCFRTLTGAEEFAANRGYISTARKNDQNIFKAIRSAFDNRPFIPAF